MGPPMGTSNWYALLEAKLCIFYILSKFTIEKSAETPEKLTFTWSDPEVKVCRDRSYASFLFVVSFVPYDVINSVLNCKGTATNCQKNLGE